MAAADVAEIHRVDLSGTLLALHAWGLADPSRFGWFEPPAADRLQAADATLHALGALGQSGQITEVGRRLLDIPAPPRLARLLLEASRHGMLREGASIAAILSEKDIVTRGSHRRPETHGPSDVLVRLDRLAEAETRRFAPACATWGSTRPQPGAWPRCVTTSSGSPVLAVGFVAGRARAGGSPAPAPARRLPRQGLPAAELRPGRGFNGRRARGAARAGVGRPRRGAVPGP